MRNALKRIQNGEYAKMFIQEGKTNYPSMTARRRLNAVHPIETVGGQAARHDAVDQEEQAGRPVQELLCFRCVRAVWVTAPPLLFRKLPSREKVYPSLSGYGRIVLIDD
jgi:hypothetical protein